MHKTGNFIINNNSYMFGECLFDTGAESNNFIGQKVVDNNIDIMRDFISENKCSIRLGDSTTCVNISEMVTLSVTFTDSNFVSHEAVLNF